MTTRRRFLQGFAVWGLSPLLIPPWAGGEARPPQVHTIEIDLPLLGDDPVAVPIRVSADHPMEPDHFVRSFEVILETDPVPSKGKFLFTPANGRPWVAFQFRSGAGGVLKVVAECTRHGRFVATREIRVVEGGCATAPGGTSRAQPGNPMIRLPQVVRAGEVVEVRAKVDHNSSTGLVLKGGRHVREMPEFYVKQMLVYLDDEKVSEFQMTSAVSPNPLIRFPLKVPGGGTLRVAFINSEGQGWEAARPIRSRP